MTGGKEQCIKCPGRLKAWRKQLNELILKRNRKLLENHRPKKAHSRWKEHREEGRNHGIRSLVNAITEGRAYTLLSKRGHLGSEKGSIVKSELGPTWLSG